MATVLSRRSAFPLAILLVGLMVTALLVFQLASMEQSRARSRFDALAAGAVDDIRERLLTQLTLLRGAAGLFNGSHNVTLPEFRAYVRRLQLPANYTGVLGIGYAPSAADPAELEAIAALGRRAHGDSFRSWPPGTRDGYSSILFLEPFNRRNREALGFDMLSEPTRRHAMLAAQQSGRTIISGRVELVQEIGPEKQPGFLMYTPLYRSQVNQHGAEPAGSFYGWVYSPLRAYDFFGPLFDRGDEQDLAITIHQGPSNPANLLFQTAAPDRRPLFTTVRVLRILGTEWTVRIATMPSFASRASLGALPATAGVAGILVTLLLAALSYRQSREAQRIERQVDQRTAELHSANEQLREQIDARTVAEDQLRHMQRIESLGQLTGGISHDFNNMLAVIIGNLDLAKRRIDKPEVVARLIAQANAGAERAAALTQRLLAFSRQQSLRPQAVDLNRLVPDMLAMLERTLGEKVTLATELTSGPLCVHADPTQLESALVNLAVNARDAMPEGGQLTIRTERPVEGRSGLPEGAVGWAAVAVSDTGEGMPDAVRARAFDPFFTTKEVGQGTGLGLSQVLGFVRQSGGDVLLESNPGEGTTVRLVLPLRPEMLPDSGSGPTGAVAQSSAISATEEEKTASPSEEEPSAGDRADIPSGRRDEVILVAEDEDQVRDMTVAVLEGLGYTALAAGDGVQALVVLERHPEVRLLFSDVVMPNMDGPMLAEEVRRRWPDKKLIFATGYAPERLFRNRSLGEDIPLLRKPFTESQLANCVREVLDSTDVALS